MRRHLPVLLVAFFLLPQLINAQIAGPNSGGTFANVPRASSNQSWTNTGNAAASDNSYSTFGNLTGGVGSYTDYLQITNFGFSIPLTAVITGIEVEIERADPNSRTSDGSIMIVQGGTITGTEHSSSAGYSSSDNYYIAGNSGDLWGAAWTAADINSSGFGVAISARRSVSGGTTAGRIDHVRITVYYNFTLPLKLLNFTVTKKDSKAAISFTTSDEVNMSHFEIQRSTDARNFSTISRIESRNSQLTTSYNITDDKPIRGTSFYRLKMVNTDGSAAYSKTLSINFNNGKNYTLYGNPFVKGQPLYINNNTNERLTVQFYNLTGQHIANIITGSNTLATDALMRYNGWTFYKIYDATNQMVSQGKLLIQ